MLNFDVAEKQFKINQRERERIHNY